MDSRTHLDYALFQLTPTRTRCDLVIFAGGKNEKLASGLVEPFISHLKVAKDQIPKGGYSITLRPPNAQASWFTKATFQRVVRFISTPEILERFVRIEREIVQIEGSIRSNELATTDAAVNSGEGSLSAANDVTKGSPDSSKIKGETGKKDVAEDENSKICLQRTLETRKVLLRKEQAMAYARALVAGFDMVNNDDLMLFSDAFGATRLREACLEFKDLCKKKLTDTLWMDELAAMAACPPSELPYLGTSGIILTSEGNNTDGDLPVADQTPSTPAKVQVHLPWQNQMPPCMYNYQNSVQGFPYPGMQPVPPYYPGHMHWSPNMDDSGNRQRRRSSSRKKGKSSETSSEEEEMASGDSDDGTEQDAVKKHDEDQSSGEKPITRKHRKKSSKTVVIRNINYITSDKRNGEKGGDSEDDSSVNGELIDEGYLKQKVQDAVGSLEKLRKSKSRANKNKGADQHDIENGSDDLPNGDSENVQASGGKHSAWDALQNLLMREDDSAFSGNKEEHFGNSNTMDLGYEKGAMRKITANDSFIVSNRAEGNAGRGNLEDFANAENMRSLMSRGETVDTQLLVSRNLDGTGQRTVSDFIPEPSTIKKATGEDWFVMNKSTISENQGQTMFNGDYALSTNKEKSKTVPAIDDSFMVQTRASADENSQWRTDISMMEGSNVVSQSETDHQDLSNAKSVCNSYEPDDLCVMLGRDSGVSPGASCSYNSQTSTSRYKLITLIFSIFHNPSSNCTVQILINYKQGAMEDWDDVPAPLDLKKDKENDRWADEDADEDDIKESWEDEEPTPVPVSEPPAEKPSKKTAAKANDQKGKSVVIVKEEPLDPVAEKLRQQRLVEEADFKNTTELFGKPGGSDKSVDIFIPKSESDFSEYAELISNKLRPYEKSFHYIGLLKTVIRLSMTTLKASDAKEVASSVTAIANEKLKAEKEANAGKKKTGAKKKQLIVDKPDDESVVSNLDSYDDFDFM